MSPTPTTAAPYPTKSRSLRFSESTAFDRRFEETFHTGLDKVVRVWLYQCPVTGRFKGAGVQIYLGFRGPLEASVAPSDFNVSPYSDEFACCLLVQLGLPSDSWLACAFRFDVKGSELVALAEIPGGINPVPHRGLAGCSQHKVRRWLETQQAPQKFFLCLGVGSQRGHPTLSGGV